jgi:hypothetical protein
MTAAIGADGAAPEGFLELAGGVSTLVTLWPDAERKPCCLSLLAAAGKLDKKTALH